VAEATIALLRDEARARRMALAARARIVERFTVEAMVRRTTAAYDECLRAAASRRRAEPRLMRIAYVIPRGRPCRRSRSS
jgi:hypothetical protein